MREQLRTFWPDEEDDDETRSFTFARLAGKRIAKTVGKVGDRHFLLYLEGDRVVYLYHPQDCCESVDLADIVGDMADLQGAVVVSAEVTTNKTTNSSVAKSTQLTYYNIQTNKGYIQLMWFGSSNGYYSSEVDCLLIKGADIKTLEERLGLL